MKRLGILASLLFLTAIVPSAVPAADEAPANTAELMKKGMAAVNQKEWLVAIRYFHQAQEAAKYSPEALFNLGLAESQVPGRELRAIYWFRTYLEVAPDAPNAAKVRDEIMNLEVRVEGTLEKLLIQCKDLAAKQTDENQRRSAYGRIGEAQAIRGDFAAALQTAATIGSAEDSSLATIAKLQADAGDLYGARSTIQRIQSIFFACPVYYYIAQLQARKGDTAGARASVVDAAQCDKENKDLQGRIYDIEGVASAALAAGKKQDALAIAADGLLLVQAWERELADRRAHMDYTYALDSRGDLRRVDAAAARKQAADAVLNDKGLVDGPALVFAAIQAEAGDFQAAFRTAATATKSGNGFRDSVVRACTATVEDKFKAGDERGAYAFAEQLKQSRYSSGYGAIFEIKLKARDYAECSRLLDILPETYAAKPRCIGELAEALWKSEKHDEAMQLLVKTHPMLAKWSKFDVDELISAQLLCEDWEGLAAAEKITSNNWKLSEIATTLAKTHKFNEARAIIERIVDYDYLRNGALSSLAQEQAKAGDLDAALQTVAAMKGKESDLPSSEPLKLIASLQAGAGNLNAALRTTALTTDEAERGYIYGEIAQVESKAGRFASALDLVGKISKIDDRQGVLYKIATDQAQRQQFTSALETVSKMNDSTNKNYALDSIISRQGAVGDLAGALKTAGLHTDAGRRASAYGSVVNMNLGRGDLAGALLASRQLSADLAGAKPLPLQRVQSLAASVQASLALQQLSAGRQSLAELVDVASTIPDPKTRIEALGDGVSASEFSIVNREVLGILGRQSAMLTAENANWHSNLGWSLEGALSPAELKLGAWMVPPDKSGHDEMLYSLGQRAAAHGDLKGAEEIAALLKGSYYGKSVRRSMLDRLIRDQKWDQAESFAATIDAEDQDSAFLAMADGYIAAKQIQKAGDSLQKVKARDGREYRLVSIAEAQVEAGDLPGGKTTASAISADCSSRTSLAIAVAKTGDLAWATQYAQATKGQSEKDYWHLSLGLATVKATRDKGDEQAANTLLASLRTQWPSDWITIATTQAGWGDTGGAIETLAMVRKKEGDFDSWAGYMIASCQKPETEMQTIKGISDEFWKTKACIAKISSRKPDGARELGDLIADPLVRSWAYFTVVRDRAAHGESETALPLVDLISDEELKAAALWEVAGDVLLRGEDVSAVWAKIAAMPEGAGKAVVLLNVAREQLAGGKSQEAAKSLAAARPSLIGLTSGLTRACLLWEYNRLIASAGDAGTVHEAAELCKSELDKLPPEPKRILAESPAFPTILMQARTMGDALGKAESEGQARRGRADHWLSSLQYSLNDAVYTDMQAAVQAAAAKPNAYQILDAMTTMVKDISEKLNESRKPVVQQ